MRYWKREALAYRSGLLEDLPGPVRAPRLYAVDETDDDVAVLWLEDVSDALAGWSASDFERAARCLGRFNGAYCTGMPLPSHEFLARGWLANWVEQSAPAIHAFATEHSHPVLARMYPGRTAEVLLELWRERRRLLSGISAKRHVLSHMDAFRSNVLCPGTNADVVLIDWAFVGLASLGEEAASLLGGSLIFCGTAPDKSLEQAVFNGYVDGLHDAGWRGDVAGVRAASGCLRWACEPLWATTAQPSWRQAWTMSQARDTGAAASPTRQTPAATPSSLVASRRHKW
jgi:hypothetical protein